MLGTLGGFAISLPDCASANQLHEFGLTFAQHAPQLLGEDPPRGIDPQAFAVDGDSDVPVR